MAPAVSNLVLASLAASLPTPSRTGLGADSTRALASLSPKVGTISRTALMTLILLAPASARITLKVVCSSLGPAAASPPLEEAAATGAAATAVAVTPNLSSKALTKSASSKTESFSISLMMVSSLAETLVSVLVSSLGSSAIMFHLQSTG